MSDLDGLKEEIAYLKLWLGIMIVTGISLMAGYWAIFVRLTGCLSSGDFWGWGPLVLDALRSISVSRPKLLT